MALYKVVIDIDIPEACLDCRLRYETFCLLDSKMRHVGLDSSRPYWCLLNDAKEARTEEAKDERENKLPKLRGAD